MAKYKKNPELIEKESETGMILFNVNSGKLFELNVMGKLLWVNLGDTFETDELKKIIDEKCFNLGKDVDSDIEEFVKMAIKQEIIVVN